MPVWENCSTCKFKEFGSLRFTLGELRRSAQRGCPRCKAYHNAMIQCIPEHILARADSDEDKISNGWGDMDSSSYRQGEFIYLVGSDRGSYTVEIFTLAGGILFCRGHWLTRACHFRAHLSSRVAVLSSLTCNAR
jgi:hypothetical protein